MSINVEARGDAHYMGFVVTCLKQKLFLMSETVSWVLLGNDRTRHSTLGMKTDFALQRWIADITHGWSSTVGQNQFNATVLTQTRWLSAELKYWSDVSMCSDVLVHVKVCFIPVDILRCCSGYAPVKPEQPLGELPASPGQLRKHGGATEQGFFRSPVCVTQEKWVRVTHFLFNQVRISDQYVKVHTTL